MPSDNYKQYKGIWSYLISGVAVSLALVQLYQSAYGVWGAYFVRALHLTFVLVLVFLLEPVSKKFRWKGFLLLDLILVVASLVVGIYAMIDFENILIRSGDPTSIDLVMGAILTVLVLEATRRTLGWPLLTVVLLLLVYTRYGMYLSGPFVKIMHPGYSWMELIDYLFLSLEGIYGVPIDAAIRYIFIFMILATFLYECGVAEFFSRFSQALMGRQRGGAAKVAVISSGLMGSISGSAAANVVTTGAFTVPAMKKVGYSPEEAGAIEAAASTGGQVMPPIMAAAGFLMAAFIGITYEKVMAAAFLPSVLYFFSVGVTVHILAVKNNVQGLPKEGLPRIGPVLKERGYLILPLVFVAIYLLRGYSVTYSGIIAIGITIVLSMFRKETRLTPRRFFRALEKSSKNILHLFVTCAAAGIIVATTIVTGLASKMPYLVKSISGGNLMIGLILGALAAIILGCGMTTTAVYIIVATMIAPALVTLGAPELSAHLFLLYFGIMGNVTPPVAIAAYAGAAVAQGQLWRTTTMSFKIAIAGFLIPFIFIYNSGLLLQGTAFQILWALSRAALAVFVLPVILQGVYKKKLTIWERLICVIGLICLIYRDLIIINVIGIVILLVGLEWFFVAQTARKLVSKAETRETSTEQANTPIE